MVPVAGGAVPGDGLPLGFPFGAGALSPAVFAGLLAFSILGLLLVVLGGRLSARAAELGRSEQRHRSMFAHNPDAVYSLDLEGNFTAANPAATRMTGYGAEELLGSVSGDLIVPEDRERALGLFRETARGEPRTYEIAITHKEGHRVEVSVTNIPIVVDGRTVGVYGVAKDVTARKRAEEALREAESRYRALVETIPAITYVQELRETNISTYISPQMETMLGYTPEECTSDPDHWVNAIHPEDLERVMAEDGRTNETGEPFRMEYRQIAKDGRVVWLRDEAAVVRDEEGNPEYWLGVQLDITERKRTEEALREAEAKYRALVERGPAITYTEIVDESEFGVSTYLSPQAEAMLGYPLDRLVDYRFWADRIHPEDRDGMLAEDERTNDSHENYSVEYRMIAGDGRIVWIRDEATLVSCDGDKALWQGVMLDITDRKEAEERLLEAEDRYRTLVEQIPALIYVDALDDASSNIYTSPQAEAMLGYTPEEWLTDPDLFAKMLHPEDRERVLAEHRRTNAVGDPFEMEYRLVSRDGRVVWVRDKSVVLRDDAGRPLYRQGILMDVTERRRTEGGLRESERRFRQLFENSVDALLIIQDDTRRVVDCNSEACRSLGYTREEMLTLSLSDFVSDLISEDEKRVRGDNTPWRRAMTGEPGAIIGFHENTHRRKDGTTFPVEVGVGSIDYGGQRLILASARDITERKVLEDRLSHQAFHDALTGLPNRALFSDRLEHALNRADRHGDSVAVLFLDLDNFKYVNDSLGHEAGDELLVAVARRLVSCLRPGDTVARLGGDEFTVLLEDVGEVGDAVRAAERIADGLRDPFVVKGREVFVGASIGIAVRTSGNEVGEELMRNADLAMYGAKKEGKARYRVFDLGLNVAAHTRLELEGALHRAPERGELRLHYQPEVTLEDGRIVGFEALLRWEHPERGLIPPAQFIPIAEETGLIVPVGRWVLREACGRAKEWQERHRREPPLMVSVNLSMRQFQDPDLARDVQDILLETGLDPRCLILEMTESVAMNDAPSTVAVLQRLKDLGVGLAIDDFGTGYSSLSYLKSLPVDFLKVDRSFVEGLGDDPGDTVLVSGVVNLAHNLGLKAVAEGVETAEQLAWLRELGCDLGQGYYFEKPLPGEAAGALLEELAGSANAGGVLARRIDGRMAPE